MKDRPQDIRPSKENPLSQDIHVPDRHIHLPDGSCCTTPKRFAHLHQHTQYSMLDGAAKLKDLLKWVKEVTPTDPACAMTDHGNMHGAVHFYNYARELGVKPILGFEAYVVPGIGTRFDRKPKVKGESGEKGSFHLTMLARNLEGYKNLIKLTSRGYTEGYYYKPRIDHELLQEHSKGVTVLSGCIGAEIPQLILQGRTEEAKDRMIWYAQTFKDQYYVEIQRHGSPNSENERERELAQLQLKINAELRSLAKELGLPMVVTNDGHYVKRSDAEAHDALLAIQMKKRIDDPTRMRFGCDDFYVKAPDELRALLPESEYGDEPFDLTAHIAAQVEDDYLPVGKKRQYQLPVLPEKEGRSVAEQLRFDTYQGLSVRYPALQNPELWRELARDAYRHSGKQKAKNIIDRIGNIPQELREHMDFVARAFVSREDEPYEAVNGEGTPISTTCVQQIKDDEAKNLLLRAEYELSVIERMGFSDYFLIVADYINWAKEHGIAVGPGRGSGAGSIVAYATRITDLDPISYKLLFERFLNPARVSMPDFDIDFHDRRRGEVVQYVREKYGHDRVAQITTFMGLNSKAVLKDVLRVMGVEYARANALTKLIPVKLGRSYSLEEAEQIKEIAEILEDAELRNGWEMAKKLEGLTKASSVHAAGIVIGREPLTELVPVMLDDQDQITTQYDMKAAEDIGLVKMDFLGLRTLTLIDEVLSVIRKRGQEVDLSQIPLNDQKTFELLSRGDTLGVFQLEGDGITAYARQMAPKTIEDIIALGALYRPGPMEQIPTYIRRLHGVEEVSYAEFPGAEAKLAPILDDTYGIPVYQEQIMQIASEVAGYSLAEADLLRRSMGKKIREEMIKHREIFTRGAGEAGISEETARHIFDLLEKFADYGFNRSHAAAYGLISYQTAYLKANYPLEFMAALLTVEQGNLEKLAEYIASARASGMTVLGPDINLPSSRFEIDDAENLRFGLSAVQGISEELAGCVEDYFKGHPHFENIEQMLVQALANPEISRLRNRGVIDNLARAGALDSLRPPGQDIKTWRGSLLSSSEALSALGQKASKAAARAMSKNSNPLFEQAMELNTDEVLTPGKLEKLEMLNFEKKALGIYISGHPLDEAPMLASLATDTTLTVPNAAAEATGKWGAKVILAGVIASVEHKVTKTGKSMAFLVFSDSSGTLRITCFNRAYEAIREDLVEGVPVALVCSVKDEGEGELLVSLEDVIDEAAASRLAPELHLILNTPRTVEEDQNLDRYLRQLSQKGAPPLVIQGILEQDVPYIVDTDFQVPEAKLRKVAEELGAQIISMPSRQAALKRREAPRKPKGNGWKPTN